MDAALPQQLSDPGEKPKLVWRHKNDLKVDATYQRGMESSRSRQIVFRITWEFSWRKFGVLIVTHDGFIIDGQHRHAGVLQRADVDFVPCLIHKVDISEAAAIFVGMNRDRINITAQAIFKAEIAAKQPEALLAKEAMDEAGVVPTFHPTMLTLLKPNQTQAVSTVRAQVKTNYADAVRGMRLCLQAGVALTSPMLRASFMRVRVGDSDAVIVQHLSGTGLVATDQGIPSGFLAPMAPAVPEVQSAETVDGVPVRRFEMGGRDAMVVRTLEEAGHVVELDNRGWLGMDSRTAKLDGKNVSYATALMRANAIRKEKGFPRI